MKAGPLAAIAALAWLALPADATALDPATTAADHVAVVATPWFHAPVAGGRTTVGDVTYRLPSGREVYRVPVPAWPAEIPPPIFYGQPPAILLEPRGPVAVPPPGQGPADYVYGTSPRDWPAARAGATAYPTFPSAAAPINPAGCVEGPSARIECPNVGVGYVGPYGWIPYR